MVVVRVVTVYNCGNNSDNRHAQQTGVWGVHRATGLLATRDPGSSSEEARAVPHNGGQLEFLKKSRIQGGGEEGWQYSHALWRRDARARGVRGVRSQREMKRNKYEREREISGSRRDTCELLVDASSGFIGQELTDLCALYCAH